MPGVGLARGASSRLLLESDDFKRFPASSPSGSDAALKCDVPKLRDDAFLAPPKGSAVISVWQRSVCSLALWLPLAARRPKTCVSCGPHAFSRPLPLRLPFAACRQKTCVSVRPHSFLRPRFVALPQGLSPQRRASKNKTRRFEKNTPNLSRRQCPPGHPAGRG